MSKFKIDDKVYIRKYDYLGFITGINKEEDLYLIDNPYSEYSFQLNEDELTLLKEGDKDVIESTEVKEVLQNEHNK
jgi:predicted secreted protein